MTNIKMYIGSFLLIGAVFYSCSKKECNAPAACSDSLPTGTVCQAYWQSWVYNPVTKTCEFKGYSGCSPIGFETKEECEKCDCD